jgi:hypothetical protein
MIALFKVPKTAITIAYTSGYRSFLALPLLGPISNVKRAWAQQPSRSRMFRQSLQRDLGTQAPEWIALDKLRTSRYRWTRLEPNRLFCCESLSYTIEEGEVVFATSPHFVFPI